MTPWRRLKVEFGITGTVTLSNLRRAKAGSASAAARMQTSVHRTHPLRYSRRGTLGRLLVEASGIYMVVNTQPGGYALFDPRKSRLRCKPS